MSDVMHHSAHKWSARTYRIRQVAKQGTRARSGPQLSMFLQLAVIHALASLDLTSTRRAPPLPQSRIEHQPFDATSIWGLQRPWNNRGGMNGVGCVATSTAPLLSAKCSAGHHDRVMGD